MYILHDYEAILYTKGTLKMRKINRKTADPEILQAYEQMRHERRYPSLFVAAQVLYAIAYTSIVPVFFIPEEMRWPWAKVWMFVMAIGIVVELTLMVAWQPSGSKLRAFALIIGILAVAIAGVLGGIWLMYAII